MALKEMSFCSCPEPAGWTDARHGKGNHGNRMCLCNNQQEQEGRGSTWEIPHGSLAVDLLGANRHHVGNWIWILKLELYRGEHKQAVRILVGLFNHSYVVFWRDLESPVAGARGSCRARLPKLCSFAFLSVLNLLEPL